jgi:hypothetical protein
MNWSDRINSNDGVGLECRKNKSNLKNRTKMQVKSDKEKIKK